MTGTIEGTVSTDEGDGIEDVKIIVADAATEVLEATTTTDENGGYSVSVAPDTYDVRAEKIGFGADEERVTVGPNVTKTVNFTLIELSADVVGEITDGPGIGVLGTVTDDSDSGSSIAIKGKVTADAGYGFYTPNDARIDGTVDTIEEWQVAVDGNRGLRLAAPGEFEDIGQTYTSSGSMVVGHLNEIDAGAVGVVISGGGLRLQDSDVMGGNRVTDHLGTIGGGFANLAGDDDDEPGSAAGATVGGGFGNEASGQAAVVSGGFGNTASDNRTTVNGGIGNTASGLEATVAGGRNNTASGPEAMVGGGDNNEASGEYATVGGGLGNEASDTRTAVGGGSSNTANGRHTTIGGGFSNRTSNSSATISGGSSNEAIGSGATVPGGSNNTAIGNFSFAAGRRASADHDGAFVFGDSSFTRIRSNASNEARFQMKVHAPEFNPLSARSAKINVESIDPLIALEGVQSLEISTWEFREHDSGRHMGPMAGEFAETFGLGDDDESIATVDADGVALAAIQGLAQKLNEKDDRIAELEERLSVLESQVGSDETDLIDD
jgi:hypothetical protein